MHIGICQLGQYLLRFSVLHEAQNVELAEYRHKVSLHQFNSGQHLRFKVLRVACRLFWLRCLLLRYFSIDRACLDVAMEALHCLLLRLVHFEFSDWYFVLIALTAGEHLIPDIDVGAAPSETLLKQDLVVADFELVCSEAQLVILQVRLFAVVGGSLAFAVGALWAAVFVAMGTR